MKYAEPIYRPPSERESLLLQVTVGCSRPICTFCFVSQQKKAFRIRHIREIKEDIDDAADNFGETVNSVFLLAGDPSVVRTNWLCEIGDYARSRFIHLQHLGMYTHALDLLNKSDEELASLRRSGYKKLYVGVESGSDNVLTKVKKGVTADEIVTACKKAIGHGFIVSIQIILGLGGRSLSDEHARLTGKIIGRISPHYVAALTLMIYQNTELGEAYRIGDFEQLEFHETLDELTKIVENVGKVDRNVVFRTNHPSNALSIGGTFPNDVEFLLDKIKRERLSPQHERVEIGRGL